MLNKSKTSIINSIKLLMFQKNQSLCEKTSFSRTVTFLYFNTKKNNL